MKTANHSAVIKAGIHRKRFKLGEERHTQLGVSSKEAKDRFPFYWALQESCPTPLDMLRWKIYCRFRCIKDKEFRRAIWYMCKHDVAFFACSFVWIFEPRPPRPMPFTPWQDQIDLLAWFEDCFPERPLSLSKTRGIGATWLCTIFFYHKWLFWNNVKIAVLTKDKDLLESDDDNSLLGKFEYIHKNMPFWVRLDSTNTDIMLRVKETHMLKNRGTKGIIQGFVCTNTKVRSLRFTCIWADEFAFYGKDGQEWMTSTGGTTHCRFLVSTWNGFDDMFHHIVYEEESTMLKLFAFWQNNYERWKGAYRIVRGRVELVDKTYKHTPEYEFGVPDLVHEGTLRSPWVDGELLEPGVDQYKMMRDIYGMEACERDAAFFKPITREILKQSIENPCSQGNLDPTSAEYKLLPSLKSEVRLWIDPIAKPSGPYVAGFDLAFGTGASYTAMQVVDSGGIVVLQYGTNTTDIKVFAANAVKISRWMTGEEGDGWMLFDFEANGAQAADFYEELDRLGYTNIHTNMTRTTARPAKGVFKPRYYGTWNEDGNHANFTELERAILSGDIVVKSNEVFQESRLFGRNPEKDGQPVFPRMSKLGHGDYMAALGIAWHRAKSIVSVENRGDRPIEEPSEPWLRKDNKFEPHKHWSDSWR